MWRRKKGRTNRWQHRLKRAFAKFIAPMTRRQYSFTYPFPPAEVVEFFREYYGPTNRAFASLGETDARKLRDELEALWSAHNRGGDELTVVSSEYLEVIAVKA
jgi:hypothetical protein